MSDLNEVYDKLASATADADQTQALIDECRRAFPSDSLMQLELDRQQTDLLAKRERIKMMKFVADILRSPIV